VEEELSSVKRTMAAMAQQHFFDLKRARDGATSSPRSLPPGGPGSPRLGGGGGGGGTPPGSALRPPAGPPRDLERRASFSSDGGARPEPSAAATAGREGRASGSPVAAHRLEIQLHQQERQIAEQQAKIEAQVQPRSAPRPPPGSPRAPEA
jgi:hypothetical protein